MSTLINAPFMPLFERIESEEDVNDLVMQILDQLFHKPVLFVRFMVVDELIRDGITIINPEDGLPLTVASAALDATIVKAEGKVRFNIVKTVVTSKMEFITESMRLVGSEADVKDLLVETVNILNVLLPASENDGESTESSD